MSFFEGKDILVTGGCGSIGSEIVRQLTEQKPSRIRVLDNHEAGHFYLNQKLNSPLIRNFLGDIRDKERVLRAVDGADIIFHAAAYKHVPFCEYNPFEAVLTNVMGTKNIIEAAMDRGVSELVGISTDKAVNPINTMGASKLLSEKIIVNAPLGYSKLKVSCVRFGNVLDSAGSVIPIFRHQISQGGPVTVTSEEMTRFFMTIPDAVRLTLHATENMNGREVFVLKMNAVKITDLAEVMIEALAKDYGYNPADINVEIIGKRPGEKFHEALFTEEEAPYVEEKEDLFILRNSAFEKKNLLHDEHRKPYQSDNIDLLDKKQLLAFLKENQIL